MDEAKQRILEQYTHSVLGRYCPQSHDSIGPQTKAFAYSALHGGLPVFAEQLAEQGYAFWAIGWYEFFRMYSKMKPEQRVFTEIIRVGFPLNFYVDAELMRTDNPEFTPGSDLEKQILLECKNITIKALVTCFPEVKEEEIEVIELDASDAKKLSRHFTFRMKGCALADCETAQAVYDRLTDMIPEGSILWVNHEKYKEKVCFLDCAVYTRNRQFRIYQSRKLGGTRYLYAPGLDKPGDDPNETFFWKSLVSYFPIKEILNLKTLELKTTRKRKRNKLKDTPQRANNQAARKKIKDAVDYDNEHWLALKLKNILPYRAYAINFQKGSTTIFYFVDSHECEMYGEAHRGNHITYNIDLAEKTYRQGCPAKRCIGKVGRIKKIPTEYHDDINKYLNEERNVFSLKKTLEVLEPKRQILRQKYTTDAWVAPQKPFEIPLHIYMPPSLKATLDIAIGSKEDVKTIISAKLQQRISTTDQNLPLFLSQVDNPKIKFLEEPQNFDAELPFYYAICWPEGDLKTPRITKLTWHFKILGVCRHYFQKMKVSDLVTTEVLPGNMPKVEEKIEPVEDVQIPDFMVVPIVRIVDNVDHGTLWNEMKIFIDWLKTLQKGELEEPPKLALGMDLLCYVLMIALSGSSEIFLGLYMSYLNTYMKSLVDTESKRLLFAEKIGLAIQSTKEIEKKIQKWMEDELKVIRSTDDWVGSLDSRIAELFGEIEEWALE